MKLLVAGSRGFIGGAVGCTASNAGIEVLGLGRASQPRKGWQGAYVQTDVASSDLSDVISQFKPDIVLHAAGSSSVKGSLDAPLNDFRAAMLTWANLLESVRRSGQHPKIIFLSSAAVYGNVPVLPVAECAPINPISPYGFHKAACELLAQEYAKCFNLELLVVRLFSVFGPDQKRLLVWELYDQAKRSLSIELHGSGEETRDYLHINDVASALMGLFKVSAVGNPLFVNVGSGEEIKVKVLAREVCQILGTDKTINYKREDRQGDPTAWRADNSVLRQLVPAWKPHPLQERVVQCIAAWEGGA